METVTETTTDIDALVSEVQSLRAEIEYLTTSHNAILALISELTEQVGPILESLKSSPIAKMMGV